MIILQAVIYGAVVLCYAVRVEKSGGKVALLSVQKEVEGSLSHSVLESCKSSIHL